MSDTIKVKIEGSQTVYYAQTKVISIEEYERYRAKCDEGDTDEAFDRAFGHLIDPQDISHSDCIEDLYMTVVTDG